MSYVIYHVDVLSPAREDVSACVMGFEGLERVRSKKFVAAVREEHEGLEQSLDTVRRTEQLKAYFGSPERF
jgi:hypothetical protein